MVAFLPFPTRLVAEALNHESSERVVVTLYGLTLLAIRIVAFALDAYARREGLYSPPDEGEEQLDEPRELRPVLGGDVIAILVGLAVPGAAVVIYFGMAIVHDPLQGDPTTLSACPSVPPLNGESPG